MIGDKIQWRSGRLWYNQHGNKHMSGSVTPLRKGVWPMTVYQALMLAFTIAGLSVTAILGIVSIIVMLSDKKK